MHSFSFIKLGYTCDFLLWYWTMCPSLAHAMAMSAYTCKHNASFTQ